MRRKYLNIWRFSSLLLLLLPVSLWAQSFNSSISGTVTDPTGAVVPDATLTLTAVDTKKVSTAKTDPEGRYSFPNLQAGN